MTASAPCSTSKRRSRSGKALLGPDHPEVAVSLNNLASLYRKTGDFERAEPLYEKALAIWEKSSDPIHDQLADTLRSLAAIRQRNGDYERAESLLKRALALEEKARGADHTETAVALSNLASLYSDSATTRAPSLFWSGRSRSWKAPAAPITSMSPPR